MWGSIKLGHLSGKIQEVGYDGLVTYNEEGKVHKNENTEFRDNVQKELWEEKTKMELYI